MKAVGRMFWWIALIVFGSICGVGIERDATRSRAEKAPVVQKVAEIEKRIVYLVDDLRTCQSASPVICSCQSAVAEVARKEGN